MFDDIPYLIGQVLGIVAVVVGFFSYQMKTARKLLIFEIVVALIFTLHYLMIGAYTAVALNLLSMIQGIFYYFRTKKGSKNLAIPIIFTALVIVTSILTWEGWYSVFIMLGLATYSVAIAFADAQKIRSAMFIKCPLCLTYNIFVMSGGGIIYECTVLVSSIIGLIKNRSKKAVKVENNDGKV